MRWGIFGGSFDPVHYGHLLLAESCREHCALDRVWFVPAATPPHKRDRMLASAQQRVEMLQLAIAGHPVFDVSTVEIDRGGLSYTVDTLAAFHEQKADAELFLLMGADTLEDLPHWRQPERICELALPVVVRRPGAGAIDVGGLDAVVSPERQQQIAEAVTEMPLVGFSSSDIRQRVRQGRSIRYLTPRAVEKYIEHRQLYRDDAGSSTE